MQPDNSHIKGERKSDRSNWADSLWEINSKLGLNEGLEAHILELLNRIEPVLDRIRGSVGPNAKFFFWCAHYTNAYAGFCGGPNLSARLLSKIGRSGIDLSIQTYANTDMGK